MLILLFVLEAHVNDSLSKNNRHNLIIVLYGTELFPWSAANSELSTFLIPAKAGIWLRLGGDKIFIYLDHTADPLPT